MTLTANASSRAEETRARLLAAAQELFAREGFEGVTTRALCARAGVNLAAIPYHFGGKEGVYLAVADAVCDALAPPLHTALAQAQAVAEAQPTPAGAAQALQAFVPTLCDAMFDAPQRRLVFALLLREALAPGAAFEVYFRRLLEPMHAGTQALLQRLLPDLAGDELVVLTHAFLGPLGSFVTGRATLLRRLAAGEDYSKDDLVHIRAALARFTATWVAGALAQAGVQSAP